MKKELGTVKDYSQDEFLSLYPEKDRSEKKKEEFENVKYMKIADKLNALSVKEKDEKRLLENLPLGEDVTSEEELIQL